MKKLVTSKEMKLIENQIFLSGISSENLIKEAAKSITDFIENNFKNLKKKSMLIIAGSGNNGLDGITVAKNLQNNLKKTEIWIFSKSPKNKKNLNIVQKNQLNHKFIYDIDKEIPLQISKFDLILDAIIGIGVKFPLRDETTQLLDKIGKSINHKKQIVISIDNPSSLNTDNGNISTRNFKSDFTLMLGYPKLGCHIAFQPEAVGNLRTLNIGFKKENIKWEFPKRHLLDKKWATKILPKRPLNSHKGTSGSTLVICGSINYPGAAFFSGSSGGCVFHLR